RASRTCSSTARRRWRGSSAWRRAMPRRARHPGPRRGPAPWTRSIRCMCCATTWPNRPSRLPRRATPARSTSCWTCCATPTPSGPAARPMPRCRPTGPAASRSAALPEHAAARAGPAPHTSGSGRRPTRCHNRACSTGFPTRTMSGNTLGTLFCGTNFGESHGPAIGCVVDGCPPGLALDVADIQAELDRRRPGTSRHVTQRQEADQVEILSGVYEGVTTGTPIALLIRNTDARSKDYSNSADTFRPGHADFTYTRKYGLRDPRGGGRSSARLTAPTVAAGAIAKKWLAEHHGVRVRGYMSQLGPIAIPFVSWDDVPANPFYAPNAAIVPELEAYMD